jgi:hypothetical protein
MHLRRKLLVGQAGIVLQCTQDVDILSVKSVFFFSGHISFDLDKYSKYFCKYSFIFQIFEFDWQKFAVASTLHRKKSNKQ